jgi:hypothetical protein
MALTSFPNRTKRQKAVSGSAICNAANNLRVKAKRRSVFRAYARLP